MAAMLGPVCPTSHFTNAPQQMKNRCDNLWNGNGNRSPIHAELPCLVWECYHSLNTSPISPKSKIINLQSHSALDFGLVVLNLRVSNVQSFSILDLQVPF